MADEFVPTTEQVRNNMALGAAFSAVALREGVAEWRDAATDVDWPYPGYRAEIKARFDRWLAAHDAEIREQIAREIDARASQADGEDYTGGPAYTSGVRYGLTIAAAIARGAS